MASPWEQMLSIFGGNIQAMRDSIAAGQTDVDPSILAQINAALGGMTNYSGPGGAGVGLGNPQGGGASPASPPPNSACAACGSIAWPSKVPFPAPPSCPICATSPIWRAWSRIFSGNR